MVIVVPGHALQRNTALPVGSARRKTTTYAGSVPRLSFFYGITIWMYWNEGAHARPHFYARYVGQAASVDFEGELVAGSLSPRALALVREWATLHRDDLVVNWGTSSPRGATPANRTAALRYASGASP
jgi:hypothetical protein